MVIIVVRWLGLGHRPRTERKKRVPGVIRERRYENREKRKTQDSHKYTLGVEGEGREGRLGGAESVEVVRAVERHVLGIVCLQQPAPCHS